MGPKMDSVALDSGESRKAEWQMPLDSSDLPAGEYEVAVTYYAKSRGLLKDAKEDLKSNVVKFSVKAE